MKKLVFLFLMCFLVASCSSCSHNQGSTNPAVVRAVTLLDAENTVNAIAHGLAAANGTLGNLRTTEPDYYIFAHDKLAQIARLNDKANSAILAANNGDTTVDWKAAVFAVSQIVGDPQSLTTFGFKNPKSQQIVQAGFATLITAISVAASYGGK